MSKPIIFMDLDGVVYQFLLAFWDELVWYHGYSEDQYSDYQDNPNKYIDTPVGRQLLTTPIIYERVKCTYKNKEALDKLAKNYEIWYVTARPESCYLATKHWITRERLPIDKLVFEKDKGKLAEQIKPLFAVDDQEHNVESMKPYTQVFLMDQLYNRNYDCKYRINHLLDLVIGD